MLYLSSVETSRDQHPGGGEYQGQKVSKTQMTERSSMGVKEATDISSAFRGSDSLPSSDFDMINRANFSNYMGLCDPFHKCRHPSS